MENDELTIRLAADADADALERLAQLDSRMAPTGSALIAERGSRPIAALTIEGREVVADPFVHTGQAVELLRLRASQLETSDRGGFRPWGRGAFSRILRAAS